MSKKKTKETIYSGAAIAKLVDGHNKYMRNIRVDVIYAQGVPNLPTYVLLPNRELAVRKLNFIPTTYIWYGKPSRAQEEV